MSTAMTRILAGAALGACAAAAQALTVEPGNNPQPDQSNVLREACGLSGGASGLTITGCLNDGHHVLVEATSDESLVWEGGGQARIEASVDEYSQLMISSVGQMINSVVLNIQAVADGFVSFSDGTTTSSLFALDGNGSNFFTITGGPFASLTLRTFSDAAGTVETDLIDDTRQIRLAVSAPIPEPETYALMLAGLGVIGLLSRRRRALAA